MQIRSISRADRESSAPTECQAINGRRYDSKNAAAVKMTDS